jgi:hypothetical protein
MTRLEWDTVGERVFEAGVDHGVLYVDGYDGVAWHGLTSVSESPSGAELAEFYIDGIKYHQYLSAEEFVATIEAFTYPDEFAICDGTRPAGNGLFMTQQPRKPFGLSYRSKIGNDVRGLDHGYKIHLIYNALAAPSSRQRSSLGENVEPMTFSWNISTKPPTFIGYKPTAHMVIDSLETPSDLMQDITSILYGDVGAPPRLPSVPELISIFNSYQTSYFDAGYLVDPYFNGFDAGVTPEDPETDLISGGIP